MSINKEKIDQLFNEIKNEIFVNATDEEYNSFMKKVQDLRKEICE